MPTCTALAFSPSAQRREAAVVERGGAWIGAHRQQLVDDVVLAAEIARAAQRRVSVVVALEDGRAADDAQRVDFLQIAGFDRLQQFHQRSGLQFARRGLRDGDVVVDRAIEQQRQRHGSTEHRVWGLFQSCTVTHYLVTRYPLLVTYQ